jgi:short-subunit dehydrogenase
MRRDLSGRVVLVTGASRGIGRRTAEQLGRHGARLAVTGRSAGELESLAKRIREGGTEVEVFPADLADPAAREGLIRDVVTRFGGLDVLINCAGVASFGEFATSNERILRRVMEINFFVPAELIRLAQPYLLRSTITGPPGWRPAIVNVASICGRCGIPSLPEHCGSKHALVGLTEALRGEFARYDIDVLLVLPGVVRSDDLNRHLLRNEGKIYLNYEGAQTPESAAASVVRSLVRNRIEAATGFVSWWVWFGKRFFPRVPRWVMHWKARRWARKHG